MDPDPTSKTTKEAPEEIKSKENTEEQQEHKDVAADHEEGELKEIDVQERKKITEENKTRGRTLDQDPEELTEYELPQPKFAPDKFKFITLSGNYPQSVREALKRRMNWTEMDDEALAIENAHLMWRPCNYGSTGFAKLTDRKKNNSLPLIYNHFEYIR